jgi:hypothetical protein
MATKKKITAPEAPVAAPAPRPPTPKGAVWVCRGCGRLAFERTMFADSSCFLNAVLCHVGGDGSATNPWIEYDASNAPTEEPLAPLTPPQATLLLRLFNDGGPHLIPQGVDSSERRSLVVLTELGLAVAEAVAAGDVKGHLTLTGYLDAERRKSA